MRIPWTLVVALVTFCSYTATATKTYYNPRTTTTANEQANTITLETKAELFTDLGIQDRLSRIDIPFDYTYTDFITRQIKQYITTGKRDTELILGRAKAYNAVFEHYLDAYNLPSELRFLPMIESGYRLSIRSHAGAVGMWQMMSITARHYKLNVNEYIDDRHDIYKSTEAAVKMLSDMYKMFGDWSLVLAAYNSGPGRVQKAIRTAGTKNFDIVKNYLPKETQLYIPKFVAAAYIANYYQNHGLIAKLPRFDLKNTRTLHIYQNLSLRKLSTATGIDYNSIAKLNPVFLKGYIPASEKGNFLIVPEDKMDIVRKYLVQSGTLNEVQTPNGKFKMNYTVEKGETIDILAKRFKCTVQEIMIWNNLKKEKVVINQDLILYLSKEAAFNRV